MWRNSRCPDRENLQKQLNAWAYLFHLEHGREPDEIDIPSGGDIERYLRDYRMTKMDAEFRPPVGLLFGDSPSKTQAFGGFAQ